MNANPNDPYSPYIDIVERTGSQVYDVDLKVRLGDLSGIAAAKLYGSTNPGFGLFSENVFLTGGITAQTGSFTGIVHVGDTQIGIGLDDVKKRDGTDLSDQTGIRVNQFNYWLESVEE